MVTFRSITIKALEGPEGDASDISMQSQMDAAGGSVEWNAPPFAATEQEELEPARHA